MKLDLIPSVRYKARPDPQASTFQANDYYPPLNSVYRTPRHNLAVGSTSANSNHMVGEAVDLLLLEVPIVAGASSGLGLDAAAHSRAIAWRVLRVEAEEIYGRARCEKRGDQQSLYLCPTETGGLKLGEVSIVHADQGLQD